MEKKITFEAAMQRLNEIIQILESNQIVLEDSINLFQEGVELSKICSQKLENIENKVAQVLVDGNLLNIEE